MLNSLLGFQEKKMSILNESFEYDLDTNFFEPTIDQLEAIEAGKLSDNEFSKDASDEQLREYMRLFFSDKSMSFGGPIPPHKLYTKENVDLVRGMDLCNATDVAHIMLRSLGFSQARRERKLFPILGKARQCGIPKSYSGGILLLYIELCMGATIP